MSLLNHFYSHPLILGGSLLLAGFSAGFAVNQFFSDHLHKVESVENGRKSTDVSNLQQQVLAKDENIQVLSSELDATRNELLRLRNVSGSEGVSFQTLNQKYNSLSQNYAQLSGMYNDLKYNFQKSQQNCNVLNRIDFLEQKRRSLENQLSGIRYDPYEKDPDGKRREIQLLLDQNHQQLLSFQQQLAR